MIATRNKTCLGTVYGLELAIILLLLLEGTILIRRRHAPSRHVYNLHGNDHHYVEYQPRRSSKEQQQPFNCNHNHLQNKNIDTNIDYGATLIVDNNNEYDNDKLYAEPYHLIDAYGANLYLNQFKFEPNVPPHFDIVFSVMVCDKFSTSNRCYNPMRRNKLKQTDSAKITCPTMRRRHRKADNLSPSSPANNYRCLVLREQPRSCTNSSHLKHLLRIRCRSSRESAANQTIHNSTNADYHLITQTICQTMLSPLNQHDNSLCVSLFTLNTNDSNHPDKTVPRLQCLHPACHCDMQAISVLQSLLPSNTNVAHHIYCETHPILLVCNLFVRATIYDHNNNNSDNNLEPTANLLVIISQYVKYHKQQYTSILSPPLLTKPYRSGRSNSKKPRLDISQVSINDILTTVGKQRSRHYKRPYPFDMIVNRTPMMHYTHHAGVKLLLVELGTIDNLTYDQIGNDKTFNRNTLQKPYQANLTINLTQTIHPNPDGQLIYKFNRPSGKKSCNLLLLHITLSARSSIRTLSISIKSKWHSLLYSFWPFGAYGKYQSCNILYNNSITAAIEIDTYHKHVQMKRLLQTNSVPEGTASCSTNSVDKLPQMITNDAKVIIALSATTGKPRHEIRDSIMNRLYLGDTIVISTTNSFGHKVKECSNDQLAKQINENSNRFMNPLLVEAKGVAGMGKAGGAGGEGQGGSDKAGQRVPRETYLALSYACTWILFTLSVPVIFYGLNKILGKVKVCCGCKKPVQQAKQEKKKSKQNLKRKLQQQSTQSLITTISGQIAQAKGDTQVNNSRNNNVVYNREQQYQPMQSQNHHYLNEYFSSEFNANHTNESFRSKVKAPKLKQLEPQATIGKYHLQQHQLEMLHNSLMSNNLALYQQQQSALTNSLSQQDFDKRSDTRVDKRNCYDFLQLNGYNLPLLKPNYNHNNPTTLYNNGDGLTSSNIVKSTPNIDQSHLLQQPQNNKVIKHKKSKQQCPTKQNFLIVDNANTTSSSTSSKSNTSKKETPPDILYTSKLAPIIPYKQQHQHDIEQPAGLTFGPMNHSHSMNLTDLNSYNTIVDSQRPNLNSDFVIGAKTMSHYPDLKVDSNFDYSLLMRDNMAR